MCEKMGRFDSFKMTRREHGEAWRLGMPNPPIYWDSDVAKWIEAASYSLAKHPDADLERKVDEVVNLVALSQQPDGYLNVHFTVVAPNERWATLRDMHELYCAGHLLEAAVAHHAATGKRALLAPMIVSAARSGSLLPLTAMRGQPGRPGGVRLFYAQAPSLVRYLAVVYR